jgi:hypothetical protein
MSHSNIIFPIPLTRLVTFDQTRKWFDCGFFDKEKCIIAISFGITPRTFFQSLKSLWAMKKEGYRAKFFLSSKRIAKTYNTPNSSFIYTHDRPSEFSTAQHMTGEGKKGKNTHIPRYTTTWG